MENSGTMEGFAPGPATNTAPTDRSGLRRDLLALVVLVLLATSIKVWLICHTEVAARDSIGFIRYALQLEHRPWSEVLLGNKQHPGYPMVLLLVSQPVRHFLGTDSFSMQLSCQLASALAGVLLVFPMFYLGKEVFDRFTGFWGAALFQCLPVSGQILADGISEATFLLFMATGVLVGIRAQRTSSVLLYGLCGICAGLAYLTRPEGALLVVAVGLVLVGRQFTSVNHAPRRRAVACALSLVVAAVAVGSPYAATIGQFTIKPTGKEMLKTVGLENDESERPPPNPETQGQTDSLRAYPRRGPVPASLFAVWAAESQKGSLIWGFWAVCYEMLKGFAYVAMIPMLLGMWWLGDRFRSTPGSWMLLLTFLLHMILVWRLAVAVGYISERHVLLLLLVGVYCVVGGFGMIGTAVGAGLRIQGNRATIGMLLALTISGIVMTLRPLHANRAGIHAAGVWLGENTSPADPIIDPFSWAHYYAERIFWEETDYAPPPGYRRTYYTILDRPQQNAAPRKQKLIERLLPFLDTGRSDSEHSRLPLTPTAIHIAKLGHVVYHWPPQVPVEQAKVLVYAVGPVDP